MGELQGRGMAKASIRELYVVSIVAYQVYQDRCRPEAEEAGTTWP